MGLTSIKDKIINELIDLNLSLNGNYFEYWLELLLAEADNKFKNKNMMYKYEWLAKKYSSKPSAVERALNRGKTMMKKRIENKYNIKTKITNETVINIFKFKIF